MNKTDHLGSIGTNEKMILKWIFKKQGVNYNDTSPVFAAPCEHVNGHPDSIKCVEFIDYLSDYRALLQSLCSIESLNNLIIPLIIGANGSLLWPFQKYSEGPL